MNSGSDTASDGSDLQPQGSAEPQDRPDAVFLGDKGALPLDTRRVLVQLLLGPSVDATRQSKLWPVLLRDEAVIASRLHELFLELVIDRDHQVAFTRQVSSQDLDFPILLRKATLTFLESALLLFLRQQLTQADARGDRAVVSLTEMQEHLSVFERERNPDRAKFERQMLNAVEKAKKLSLLQRIRGGDERYEVSPTLKILFPAEEILQLTRSYAALASSDAAMDADADDASEGENEEEAS